MKHTRKDVSKSKIEVKVVLNSVDLAIPRQKAVEKLSSDIKVAGFREGKVPPHIAEKKIDQNKLTDEVVGMAINQAIIEVIQAEQIQLLDRPNADITKLVPFDTLEFTLKLDIVPPVKLGGYMNLKAKKQKIEVKDADVKSVLDNIQTQFSEKKAVKRAIAEGDEVVMDFTGFKDDKEFDGGAGKDFPLIIGSNQFIPGFEEAMIGHKTGDKFDIPLTFPKDYHAEQLKGAKVVFKVKVNKVNEVVKPEIDDKLAEKATSGQLKTAKDLKADIKRELTARAEFDSVERYKAELLNELVKKSTVEVPQVLIDDQIKALEEDFKNNLKYRGVTEEQYFKQQGFKDRDDWADKELKPQADQRVKNGMVLSELAKAEKIEVTDAEIDERQKVIMGQYNDPQLAERFKNPQVRQDIASRLATEKALNKLVAYNS